MISLRRPGFCAHRGTFKIGPRFKGKRELQLTINSTTNKYFLLHITSRNHYDSILRASLQVIKNSSFQQLQTFFNQKHLFLPKIPTRFRFHIIWNYLPCVRKSLTISIPIIPFKYLFDKEIEQKMLKVQNLEPSSAQKENILNHISWDRKLSNIVEYYPSRVKHLKNILPEIFRVDALQKAHRV